MIYNKELVITKVKFLFVLKHFVHLISRNLRFVEMSSARLFDKILYFLSYRTVLLSTEFAPGGFAHKILYHNKSDRTNTTTTSNTGQPKRKIKFVLFRVENYCSLIGLHMYIQT